MTADALFDTAPATVHAMSWRPARFSPHADGSQG